MGHDTVPEPSDRSPYLFLSYSSTDHLAAFAVADALTAEGVQVWMDRSGLSGGALWATEIARAIRSCTLFAVLCTPASIASRNVRQELQLAWDHDRTILPVLLEPVEFPDDVAYFLHGRHWIDATDRSTTEWLEALKAALVHGGLQLPSATHTAHHTPGGNLPVPLGHLIGRQADVDEIVGALLSKNRLVTLTGPGGVGKTRLALEAARQAAASFADGATFVDLSTVTDPLHVPSRIAKALGISETGNRSTIESLDLALRDSRRLLLLDNFEQVIEAAPIVVELLAGAPDSQALVTSREALRVRGEHLMTVQPLRLPSRSESDDLIALGDTPSIALFVATAQGRNPAFTLTTENAAAVIEICQRLDGLPLAIELAAARVRTLSPSALLARLEKRLPLLTGDSRDAPARQQTLRNTLEWSYNLLPPREQDVFRSLSVFVGGFTLEAAETMSIPRSGAVPGTATSPDVLDLIAALVDQSLIRQLEYEVEPRYGMLETIREYGLELLETRGELDEMRRRHANWLAELVERIRPEIEGPNGRAVLDQYEREHPNIRSALAYALETGDAELGCRIVAFVWKFWLVHTHARQVRERIEQILRLPGEVTPAYRLETLYIASFFALDDGDFELARQWAAEGLALARAEGDKHLESRMLFGLGFVARREGDNRQAAEYCEEALVLAREMGPSIPFADHMTAMILASLAAISNELGESDRASAQAQEARAIWQRRGDPWGLAISTERLGVTSLAQGDLAASARWFGESLSLYHELGDRSGMTTCISGLGIVAGRIGHWTAAVRLFASADAARERIGAPVPAPLQEELQRSMEQARRQLGERRFEAGRRAGFALTLDEAIAESLNVRLDRSTKHGSPHQLTQRELDVLRLVADGRTDREIAAELSISYRTTTTHVRNIMNKLGVDSRTAASTDAVRLGLI